ncbi:hypothetical protein N3K66_003667 [Trichothecium roseum]|uniref:Uncharacterized protein n=1 Tax=Trichothecium roseum TaxID=47278 RepID=A0ACC0V7H4_9HYPO|nr:hypothetical protein N3K66_003667 [Trichothecium roseum]
MRPSAGIVSRGRRPAITSPQICRVFQSRRPISIFTTRSHPTRRLLSRELPTKLRLTTPTASQNIRSLATTASDKMATESAVSKGGLNIPLIDFGKFLNGAQEERKATADAILSGFQNAGFIYLKNHAITPGTIKKTFSRSASFFAQNDQAKLDLGWTTPEANRGYSAPGREKVTQLLDINDVDEVRKAAPDMKESFEIGREDDPDHPNQWPQDGQLDGFKPDMMDFFEDCKKMHMEVMRAIAVGMGLEEEFFDGFVNVGDNTLRLLHYPAVDTTVFKVNPNAVRAGEHSDYGSITLLFQDNRGGLQVKSPTGQFIDATPIEGTIVVNAGDLLARWSNDTIRSTIHRVVEPPHKEGEIHPPRYSIAYFCNPNSKSLIEVLPGTYEKEQDRKYESITSGDYLVQRLAATY